jgi:hypothetical protein
VYRGMVLTVVLWATVSEGYADPANNKTITIETCQPQPACRIDFEPENASPAPASHGLTGETGLVPLNPTAKTQQLNYK